MDLIDITEKLQEMRDKDPFKSIWSPLLGCIPLFTIRVVPETQIYVDEFDGVTYVFDKYGRYNMYEYDDGKVRASVEIMLLPDKIRIGVMCRYRTSGTVNPVPFFSVTDLIFSN